MLGERSPQRSFFDAEFLLEESLPRNSFYRFVAEHRHRLFRDRDFASLYVLDNGRPSVPPSILAAALLLQCRDGASDQEARDRATYDARWAYALGTRLGEPPFAKSTLQLFRAKLVLHGGVQQIFLRSLDFAEEEGFLRGRKLKVAVDTTPVLGAAAVKDTYNLLADGIRKVIRELSVQAGLKPDVWAKANGLGRYLRGSIKGQSQVDWADEESRRRFLTGIAEDAEGLLDRVRQTPDGPRKERLAIAAALLRDLLQQDVERDDEGAKITRGVAKDRIVSVHDPEMRHGRKSAQSRFDGYKAAIAVDTDTQLITAVEVTAANQYDGDTGLPLTEATEENTGREVELTVGDAAFGDEATRRDSAEADRDLVAKVPRPPRSGQLPKEAFRIDLDQGTCTCPAGQVTSKLIPTTTPRNRRGERLRTSMFRFDRGVCDNCPLKPQCTGPFTGRTVRLHPREAELQAARALQDTPAFAIYTRMRQVAEHRIARLKQLGGGKSRYVGRPKTKAQLQLTAAVANLTRTAAWLEATSEGISSILWRLVRRAISAARAFRSRKTTCPPSRSAAGSF